MIIRVFHQNNNKQPLLRSYIKSCQPTKSVIRSINFDVNIRYA